MFEFEFEKDESFNERQIMGKLQGILKGLSTLVSGEITAEGRMEENELKTLTNMRCNFFGDFTVRRVPTTLGEAVEVLKS